MVAFVPQCFHFLENFIPRTIGFWSFSAPTPTLVTPPGSFNISPQPPVLESNHCLIILQQMTLYTKNIWLHFKGAKHSYMTCPGPLRWNRAHVCFLLKTTGTLKIRVLEYQLTCISVYPNVPFDNPRVLKVLEQFIVSLWLVFLCPTPWLGTLLHFFSWLLLCPHFSPPSDIFSIASWWWCFDPSVHGWLTWTQLLCTNKKKKKTFKHISQSEFLIWTPAKQGCFQW